MPSITKIVIGTGIGAGMIWLVNFLLGKKKLGDQLDTITQARVHSVDLKGVTIRVDVVLKNPTQYSVRLKQPYVRLLLGGDLIGSSQIVDKQIELAAYKAQAIDPIYINIPISGILKFGKTFYQSFVQGQPVKLNVITMSVIDLGIKQIPYVKTDTVTLNKQSAPAGSKPSVSTKKKKTTKAKTKTKN